MNDLTGNTAVVTGASRGFGRGVAMALAQSGLKVVALARSGEALEDLSREAQAQQATGTVIPVAADVAEADVAERVLSEYRPQLLVLVAGASPHLAPLPSQSWEGFSRNWHVDVKQSFHWLQAALALPLAPGSTVLVFSSGAALRGSPMSGGYAGAKATQAFITQYAAGEADALGLELRFHTLFPTLSPTTDLGRAGTKAYAERAGMSEEAYREKMGPPLTPELVGERVLELARNDDHAGTARFMLSVRGLESLD